MPPFTLTILQGSQKFAKTWFGITTSRPQTDAKLMESLSTLLVQSGLHEQWWREAMGCCCYLRNFQDSLASVRKKIQHSTPWFNHSLWIKDIYHPVSTKQKQASSIQLKSPHMYFVCPERGEGLDRSLTRGRCRRVERTTLRQKSTSKIRRKRGGTPKKSRSESSHFDLIRIWLKISVDVLSEKKMMDQALQKHKDTMEAKHDFWSISGQLYFVNIML